MAESSVNATANLPVESTHLEGYEVHLSVLGRRVKEAIKMMSTWERWIPSEERRALDDRVKHLKETCSRLELRTAEFTTAPRAAEEAKEKQPAMVIPAAQSVRIKPTSLPIFSGDKREYHRWRRDWENLQRQGEPSQAAEVKKIQLLNSVEERIKKDVRLSTYTAADEIFSHGKQVWQ